MSPPGKMYFWIQPYECGSRDAVVRHRDRLDRDLATGREQLVDRGEVGRPVLLADRLDHLDADDRVVLAGDLAVVDELEVDVDTGRGEPLLGEGRLLGRQRHRGHLGTALRGTDRQGAPSAADLEHPRARGDVASSRIASILRVCAASRCLLGALEPGGGVGHRRVEERREQIVGQVVVGVDVLARALDRVALVVRQLLVDEDAELLQRHRHDRRHPLGERLSRSARSVSFASGPVAGHVGLAEPDLGLGAEPGEERAWAVRPASRVAPAPPAPHARPSANLRRTGTRLTVGLRIALAARALSGVRGARAMPGQRVVATLVIGSLPAAGARRRRSGGR